MIKKYQKDIIELILISVLWLAPAARALVDYRTVIEIACFVLVMISLFLINRKGYSFAVSAILVVVSCAVYKSSFFTVTVPAILLYINRYFLNENKISKKTYNSINPLITGVIILLIIQTALAFIEVSGKFEMIWQSRTLVYAAILLLGMLFPLVISFGKNKMKKEELQVLRVICLCAVYGITLTTCYYLIKNGFYNHNLYVLKVFPWFVFVYTFVKGNGVCKALIFEKADEIVKKFVGE